MFLNTSPLRTFCFLFSYMIFCSNPLFAQKKLKTPLRSGDLIFQDLDCGGLCDAIEQVTQSYGGRHFSHIGLISIEEDSIYIIEAIGQKVKRTPLGQFVSRNQKELLLGRVKPQYRQILPAAVTFARQQIGIPYDETFLYDNGKYYCSELLYDAFKVANSSKDFFELRPMTFKQPGSDSYFPVWVDYYKKLDTAIPESAPGINPGGISLSEKIDVFIYRE